jgi:hypothetical protein
MTPNEKAVQLYRYYIDYTQGHYNCKQCALIAVDEILDIVNSIYDYDREALDPYWQEVKQEIHNL